MEARSLAQIVRLCSLSGTLPRLRSCLLRRSQRTARSPPRRHDTRFSRPYVRWDTPSTLLVKLRLCAPPVGGAGRQSRQRRVQSVHAVPREPPQSAVLRLLAQCRGPFRPAAGHRRAGAFPRWVAVDVLVGERTNGFKTTSGGLSVLLNFRLAEN